MVSMLAMYVPKGNVARAGYSLYMFYTACRPYNASPETFTATRSK